MEVPGHDVETKRGTQCLSRRRHDHLVVQGLQKSDREHRGSVGEVAGADRVAKARTATGLDKPLDEILQLGQRRLEECRWGVPEHRSCFVGGKRKIRFDSRGEPHRPEWGFLSREPAVDRLRPDGDM
jgi:hypothetical protein